MEKEDGDQSAPLSIEHARTLAERLANQQLALFVGSGLSHLAPAKDGSGRRLPVWKQLAEEVARICNERTADYDGNPLELFDAIEYGQDRRTLERAIKTALDDAAFDLAQVHHALIELPWTAVLTTNYDGLLQRLLKEEPVSQESHYERIRQPPSKTPRLFHIHGTLANPHTLTREDYRLWPEEHELAYHHLKQVLLSKTLLFVGYSFSDPHLDSLLAAVRKITKAWSGEKRLYAWMWKPSAGTLGLLNTRDKINTIPIQNADAWLKAFNQVKQQWDLLLIERSSKYIAPISHDDSYDRAQYVLSLHARYRAINLEALYLLYSSHAKPETGDLELSDIYVEPDLVKPHTSSEIHGTGTGHLGALSTAFRQRAHAELGSYQERISASRVFADSVRVVVIGGPGQGKSSLLRHSLLQTVRHWRDRPEIHPFPVYIRLADWEVQPCPPEGRLISYVKDVIPRIAEIGPSALASWLEHSVLWLLDGIDEIRDGLERSRFKEEVIATARMRPADRWIVTTRLSSENISGFSADWTFTELPQLSELQVEQILMRWDKLLTRTEGLKLDHVAIVRALKFDRGLRSLRGNALLLTLTVLFYRSRHRLPHDRWEFYDTAEEAMRGVWVRIRLRNAERHMPGDYLPQFLEGLALTGMKGGLVIFSRAQVEEVARPLMFNRHYTGQEQNEELGRLLKAAQDLVGVIVEHSPGRFSFLHLTFQEFYAARALVRLGHEASILIQRFWDHPDWLEMWSFYGLGVQYDGVAFSQVFRHVLDSVDDIDRIGLSREKMWCLWFAGLGTAPLPEATMSILHWSQHVIEARVYPMIFILRILGVWERTIPSHLSNTLFTLLDHENETVRSPAAEALSRPAADQSEVRNRLIELLSDNSEHVRLTAVASLRHAVDYPEVRITLISLLKDKSWSVRWHVILRLSQVVDDPEVRDAFLPLLNDEGWNVRRDAAQALSQVAAQPDVRERLLVLLAHGREDVQIASVIALTPAAMHPRVCRGLIALFEAQVSYRVHGTAVRSLASMTAHQNVLESLLGFLDSNNSETVRLAASSLESAADQPNVRDALLSLLTHPSERVQRATASSLAKAADQPKVQEALIQLLNHPSPKVRQSAISSLAKAVSRPRVRTALLARLSDDVWFVQWAAARSLSELGSEPRVRNAYVRLLRHGNENVRRTAAGALSRATNHIEVRSKLLELLSDDSEGVRQEAVHSLASAIDRVEVRASLLALVSSDGESDNMQRTALEALSQAAQQPEVSARLLALLDHTSDQVRQATAKSLRRAVGQPAIRYALVRLLRDEVPSVRRSAVEELSGVADESGVSDALLPLLNDVDLSVQMTAARALGRGIAAKKFRVAS